MPGYDNITLTAVWDLREESAPDCAARLARMLGDIRDALPAAAHLAARGSDRPLLAPDMRLEELAACFKPQRIYDETRKRRVQDGHRLQAEAMLDEERWVDLDIRAGAHVECPEQVAMPNAVRMNLRLRMDGRENVAAVRAMRSSLHAVVRAWGPAYAGVCSYDLSLVSRRSLGSHVFFPGTWLAYLSLSAPYVQRLALPPLVRAEMVDGGGLLLDGGADAYDADPARAAAANAIQDVIASLLPGAETAS